MAFCVLLSRYDNGYHFVTCIDYSETVINTMNQRKGKRSTLVYSVMDATKMTYENESFDVVIDKANNSSDLNDVGLFGCHLC